MSVFLLRRLLTCLATLAGASVLVFLVLEILPGNAAEVMMGPDASPEAVAALSQRLGLDRPPLERYADWIGGLLTGRMGDSHAYDSPISGLIADRLQVTLPLAFMAMAVTIVLALGAGLYAAAHHNRPGDIGMMSLSQLGIAIPEFWFGILLVMLFSVHLQWFSAGGFPGWDEGWWPALKALILPALSLAVVQASILARITRSAVLDVMREDFVRTARAKGLSRRATLWKHVLRNALIPVVTLVGLRFAGMLAGTIVVENVFSLPGLGRLIFQSISNRDGVVVRDCVMLLAAMVITINLVVDLLYALIDPRVKTTDL